MKYTQILAITTLAALTSCKPADQADNTASDSATGAMNAAGMQYDSGMMGSVQQQPGVMSSMQHDSLMKATQNMPADMQFMAMMTNHHTGLVAMAGQAMTKASDDSVKSIARNMQMQQQQDSQKMLEMMMRMGGLQHTPMMTADNKAQLDSLSAKSGKTYDKYFMQTVMNHHAAGIRMIDEFLPRMMDPDTKQMADAMKSVQQKEIRAMQDKLTAL